MVINDSARYRDVFSLSCFVKAGTDDVVCDGAEKSEIEYIDTVVVFVAPMRPKL